MNNFETDIVRNFRLGYANFKLVMTTTLQLRETKAQTTLVIVVNGSASS